MLGYTDCKLKLAIAKETGRISAKYWCLRKTKGKFMSDDREQTNDGARSPLSFEKMEEVLKSVVPVKEEREVEITQDFIENLIWRGNDTCREGIPSQDGRDGPINQPDKDELFNRYKQECSDIRRSLYYSIATTPELRRKADNLSEIINEALEIAKSSLWHNVQPHVFSTKFHELAPKWDSAIVGFFSQVNQGSETNQSIQTTPQLNDSEENIIEALGKETLTGEELAKKANHPYNSNFKNTLSSLRKRGILGNKAPGYFLMP